MAQTLLNLINQDRASAGARALQWSDAPASAYFIRYEVGDTAKDIPTINAELVQDTTILFPWVTDAYIDVTSGASISATVDIGLKAGDSNYDGKVNTADFVTLAKNFNHPNNSALGWESGDFNDDGIVNALDFNVLATNYGN